MQLKILSPLLRGGLWRGTNNPIVIKVGGTGVCLLSSFFFVEDEICKVFDGNLVYIFHESFNV